MCPTGDVAGGVGGQSNLKEDSYQAFAEYLADVVNKYKSQWGVKFRFLEAFNEPEKTWKKGNTQEGCAFTQPEYAKLIPRLAVALKKRGLTTGLVGSDGLPTASTTYNWMSPGRVSSQLAQFHVHGYQSTLNTAKYQYFGMEFSRVAAMASAYQRELWMTAWGPDGAQGSDLGIALYMTRIIASTVNIMKATSWSYWQPIDSDPQWTLIQIPWDPKIRFSMALTKKFYALQQFTKLAPQGSVPIFIQSSNVCFYCITAFYNHCKRQAVVFVTNQRAANVSLTVRMAGFLRAKESLGHTFSLYRTSASENFALVRKVTDNAKLGIITMNAQAQSLSSVVVSNVLVKGLGATC